MKIEVGDRVTYKWFDKNLNRMIEKVTLIEDDNIAFSDNTEIIKIERPNWEVVEEKKELLTEEEREFLKACIKLCDDIYYVQRIKESLYLINKKNTKNILSIKYDNMFKNLGQRVYTLSELRIGGINK